MRWNRQTAVVAALVALTLACCAYTAFSSPLGGDYPGPACSGCDYAGPPIDALADGRIGDFFKTQPFIGSVTLVLRAPVVATAKALGAGELVRYQAGSLACLLFAAGLIWLLVAQMRPRGRQWLLVAGLIALLLAGPLTAKALFWGHPEEPVGALLCVAAVVLAARGRIGLAGVSLGLALATKQWALLAVVPVLWAAPRGRLRLATVAACVAAVFMLPMLIGDPARFLAPYFNVGGVAGHPIKTSGVTPTNIWFAYGIDNGESLTGTGHTYAIPAGLASISRPLMLLLGIGLALLFWRFAKRRPPSDALLVLALVFLLRCLMDPLAMSYHHVPFLVTVAAWETLRRRGLPVITVYSALALWALGRWVAPTGDGVAMNRAYLAWALPIAAYMAIKAFRTRASSDQSAGESPKPAVRGFIPTGSPPASWSSPS
jgi:hypothetical protein